MGEEKNSLLDNNNNGLPPQNYPPPQQQGYDHNQSPYPSQPYPPQYQQQPYQQQPYQQQPYQPPQYNPQQPYPPQQGEAVMVGVAPVHHHHHEESHYFPMITESFGEQIQRLPSRMVRACTKAKVSEYNELKRTSSWTMVFFLLFIQVVWSIILACITGAIENAMLSNEYNNGYNVVYVNLGVMAGYAILSTIIFYFVMNGIFHLVAMCMGGGKKTQETSSNMFLQLCYTSMLFNLPIAIISIITIIPVIGWILAFVLLVYRFLLFVISLQSVYGVSSGHAVGIIAVFVALLIVFFIVLVVALDVAFVSALGYAI